MRRSSSRWRTAWTTGWPPGSGRLTRARRCVWPTGSRPGPCGSTRMGCSTSPYRSAAASTRGTVGSSARRRWSPTCSPSRCGSISHRSSRRPGKASVGDASRGRTAMSERIIIKQGTVVTMNDADDVIFGGTVVIEGDRIVDVGPGSEVAPRTDEGGARVIDATDKAVLPGLVDLHYHTALGKGWSDHLPLWEYLETCWYPIIRALNPEEAYWAALASYSESIKCGVTTVNDMYRQLGGLARAAEEIGIRAVLSNDVADDEHDLDTLDDNRRAFEESNGSANGRIEVYIGIEWLAPPPGGAPRGRAAP